MIIKKRKTAIVIVSVFLAFGLFYKKVDADMSNTNRNFKKITIEDGLSQGSIKAIMQDSKGYMWIGTNDGLNKYNGNKFKVFKSNKNSKESLSGNLISDIKEDLNGDIWVGTSTGLNKIDSKTNEITRYLPNVNGCNISHHRIRKIMVSRKGDVLVATEDGLNKYDRRNNNFIRLYNSTTEKNSLTNQDIYSLVEDSKGNYWVGTRSGLNRIDAKTKKVTKYLAKENDDKSISHNFIYSLHADNLGFIWIGTYYGGLNKLNLETGIIEKYMPNEENKMPGALIRDVMRDSRGMVWIATDYGFAQLNEKNNKFITYNSSIYNSKSLISNDTFCIAEENSGAIWIGTREGVNLFNPENLFNYYKSDPSDDNSLSSESLSGIYEDEEGLLWIGTIYDGLNLFDRKKDKIIRIDDKIDYDGELSISNNLVRDIEGIDNQIWIATQNGLNMFDKETGRVSVYTENEGLICDDIKSLCIGKDGILWIGTRDGLYSYDRKNTFKDYSEILKSKGITSVDIKDIYEDYDGTLWLALKSEYGLLKFDKERNKVKIYNKFDKNKSINYTNISSINSDMFDNLWLSTDSGLIKFNKKNEDYTIYTEEDGLPNNFIYSTLFEDEEHLWLSSNYGISKFNIKEESFMNFDSADGLQGNEFNEYSYFKSKSGEMFFGGTNGLTSFNPKNIKDKVFTSTVKIESISSNLGNISNRNKISLNYNINQLQFTFFLPDYRNTIKIQYAYKLEGLDKDWIVVDDVQMANYTNLRSGSYKFKVAAKNSSGHWSTPTSVNITIASPPWQTPIAYLLYVLLFVTIVLIIWNRVKILDKLVKQRTHELNNKLVENEELYLRLLEHEKYKNNYFINLSHELRTPLNIISATQNLIENLNNRGVEIQKDKMSYYMKTIKKNCGRLINLIDNIVYTSKIESGSYRLNIKEHDIVYLVEEVALSMKELTCKKNIELIIDPHMEEKVIWCDDVEIERVMINLISNAIKFTSEGGVINISVYDLGDTIKISVKDNGIGIDPKNHQFIFDRFSQEYSNTSEEHGGSGLGLTLSRQLIELHNGYIWVNSELGKGSEFIIILPEEQQE